MDICPCGRRHSGDLTCRQGPLSDKPVIQRFFHIGEVAQLEQDVYQEGVISYSEAAIIAPDLTKYGDPEQPVVVGSILDPGRKRAPQTFIRQRLPFYR